jgi:hypothetical protein
MSEVHGAKSSSGDVRVGALLLGEARRRAVTRLFGIPAADQSLLATAILGGSVAAVLRGMVPGPLPRLSGGDALIGGSILSATLRGVIGEPSRTVPFAGGLIAVAVVSHSLRPAVARSAREVSALAHRAPAALTRMRRWYAQ